jgi:hypothetical protein
MHVACLTVRKEVLKFYVIYMNNFLKTYMQSEEETGMPRNKHVHTIMFLLRSSVTIIAHDLQKIRFELFGNTCGSIILF